jgi:predicted ester cyclase
MLKAQPDLEWKVTSIIESGPLVAAEWTWTSTFTGDSPSGPVVAKRISGRGASVAVIENGRIKRFTDYYDTLSYFPKTTN